MKKAKPKKGIFAGLSDEEAAAITLELDMLRIEKGFQAKTTLTTTETEPEAKPGKKVLMTGFVNVKKAG